MKNKWLFPALFITVWVLWMVIDTGPVKGSHTTDDPRMVPSELFCDPKTGCW